MNPYTKKAIEKAKNAGWVSYLKSFPDCRDYCAIFLDPLFWQALGKAEGWGSSCWHYEPYNNAYSAYRHTAKCGVGKSKWEVEWHGFIDHLIEGKDIESFFANLLQK